MTIASAVAKSGPYAGNGSQTVFAYTFKVFAASELQVVLRSAGGIETVQSLTTHYTVSGVGNDGGGNVTMVTAPPSGTTLTIVRNVPFVQLTDLRNQGGFYPEVHERVFDRLTQQTQQLKEGVDSALRLPVSTPPGVSTTLPSPAPEKLIGWNSAGTGLQNFDASVLATLVAYGTARADLFDGDGTTTQFTLTSNPGNQSVLDVSIGGVTQRAGIDFVWTGGTTLTFIDPPPAGTDNILARYFQGLPGIITEAQDVTFTQAGIGAVPRTAQAKMREIIHARDFGAVADGVTDASAAIQAAINAAAALNGADVILPPGKIAIGSTLQIGNGSASQVSSYGAVRLIGQASESARNTRFNNSRAATTLVWTGALDGTMISINGPCQGNDASHLVLDGSGVAGYGLRLFSAQAGQFGPLSFYRIRIVNLDCQVQQIPTSVLDAANYAYASRSVTDNYFESIDIDGRQGVEGLGAIGIRADGWPSGPTSGVGFDTCRNSFSHVKMIVDRQHNATLGRAGVGIWLEFADSNNFHDTWFQGEGTANNPSTGYWLYLRGRSNSPDTAAYPVNNSFSGHLQRGQNLLARVDTSAAPVGGNTMLPLGEVDGEDAAAWPETAYIGGYQPESVDEGATINYICEYGLARIRDEWRNQFLNSGFARATRGTSFSNVSSNTPTVDMWQRARDGTVSDVITREAFALGQTDVPFQPAHFLRAAISSASGASEYKIYQRVEDARRYGGRRVTLSAWVRVSSGSIALSANAVQNFGTGGSPSASVTVAADTSDQGQTVTTAWRRVRFRFSVPSLSGKTLGTTINTSYTEFGFLLPPNTPCTFEMAWPQLEYGVADTPPDRRPFILEDALCSRYLQIIPAPGTIYGFGFVANANEVRFQFQHRMEMRVAPTLDRAGVAADYLVQQVGGTGSGSCTSLPALDTADTQMSIVTFTRTAHGLTSNTVARIITGGNGRLILSAEFL